MQTTRQMTGLSRAISPVSMLLGALLVAQAALLGCSQSEGAACKPGAADCGKSDAADGLPNKRFARLTHAQWRNTVSDLLGTTDLPDVTQGFRADPKQQGFLFDNHVDSLAVDQALWQAYQQAAAQIAAFVIDDPARLAQIAPSAGSPDDMGRAFIREFGERVHRRPLTDAQIDRYLELYASAPKVFPELGRFEAGARLLLQAFLQSPYFVYRIEGSAAGQEGAPVLDGYAIASKLSYSIWDTMPDEALSRAASAGELDDPVTVGEHARRMLDSTRAKPVLARLHQRLFETERYRAISRYPVEALPDMAAEENRLFIEHVAFEQRESLAALLTSRQTFVNATLAELYGLSGEFGDEFELVELDPTQRSGLLTQIGFLASNANSGVSDPIHRGVFVGRRLACLDIPMPPEGIPPLPAPAGRTNRETVAAHTETPGTACAGCHATYINPFGFPFEYYDGFGRYQTEDNGHPVDGTAAPALDEAPKVRNAVELAQALANSPQVHECYAKHLVEFAFGRLSSAQDEELIQQAAASSRDGDMPIKELIVQLVSSPQFSAARAEESP